MTSAPASDDRERPSKTQLKKAMQDLQDLGRSVTELPDGRLEALARSGALGDGLHHAVLEYRRTRSHEGRRRQLQYIGKLMRQVDPQPLREAVAQAQLGGALESLRLHQAERWRDELIAADDAATRWLEAHPDTDAQRLRTLVRNARNEMSADVGARRGAAFRELFKLIRDALPGTAEPAHE